MAHSLTVCWPPFRGRRRGVLDPLTAILRRRKVTFRLFVYRCVCEVDVRNRQEGWFGTSRFEALSGAEEQMRRYLNTFKESDQVLAVELIADGRVVVDRF